MKIQFLRRFFRTIVYIAALLIVIEMVRPRFIVRPEKAGQTASRAQIAAFNTALQLFKLEHGNYPQSLKELIANESGKNYLGDTPQLPKDPWGNPYRYTHPCANEHEYEIISLGADGAPGGSYDNADIVSWDLTSSYSFNMRR
ncbi:MAG: type II secretion system protein GspG [Candidatus Hydrogenedentes bacterium]|nr:type II secretion system protein GspG [Candidatus Hydrogenedentota bacterium]